MLFQWNDWIASSRKALRLALTLSEDIYVVQILAEQINIENLSTRWANVVEKPLQEIGHRAPQLIVLKSSYREFFDPLLGYIRGLASDHPDRSIAVIVPEFVERKWYHFLIPHRATLIKELLLVEGGHQIVIVDVPWYLREEKLTKCTTAKINYPTANSGVSNPKDNNLSIRIRDENS